MVVTADSLKTSFKQIYYYGDLVRLKYFSYEAGSVYDDEFSLVQSGSNIWASGLLMPIGASESAYVEQGKLRNDDRVLYLGGDVNVSGIFKIGIGSPVRDEYALTGDGIKNYTLNGSVIYRKMFIRLLPNGSLVGEM